MGGVTGATRDCYGIFLVNWVTWVGGQCRVWKWNGMQSWKLFGVLTKGGDEKRKRERFQRGGFSAVKERGGGW